MINTGKKEAGREEEDDKVRGGKDEGQILRIEKKLGELGRGERGRMNEQ